MRYIADAVDETRVTVSVHETASLAMLTLGVVTELEADLSSLRRHIGNRLSLRVLKTAFLAVSAGAVVAEGSANFSHCLALVVGG